VCQELQQLLGSLGKKFFLETSDLKNSLAVSINITVFWDAVPCNLVEIDQHLRGDTNI
jgi:hypothetical protein